MAIADLFTREDLSRPENRINVAIFGLMTVPAFAAWLLNQLSLPVDSVLYPPRNTANDAGAGRPDFVVRSAIDDRVLAYVEVECVKNEEQISRFRRMFPDVPVVALWGRPGPGCDLSLQEVADFLRNTIWTTAQARVNGQHLTELIDDALNDARVSPGRTSVGDEMWNSVFLAELRRALGSRVEKFLPGQGDMRAGEIRVDTTDTANNRGFSVRVYSPVSSQNRSVSILNLSGGRPEIRFSSKAWLYHYVPGHRSIIDELASLVETMGGDMTQAWRPATAGRPRGNNLTAVPLSVAERHAEAIAQLIGRLAERPVR